MIETRVLILQICGFVANILVGVLGCAIPYMVKNGKNTATVMSYLNCAAGGVLLGVSFIHVLPEAGRTLNSELDEFPLSYFITSAGLIIMVMLVKLGAHSDEHAHSDYDENSDEQGRNPHATKYTPGDTKYGKIAN